MTNKNNELINLCDTCRINANCEMKAGFAIVEECISYWPIEEH